MTRLTIGPLTFDGEPWSESRMRVAVSECEHEFPPLYLTHAGWLSLQSAASTLADAERVREENGRRPLAAANRKIGEARKVVEEFWASPKAGDAYDRETSWAMHVALVKLGEIFDRKPRDTTELAAAKGEG